MQNAKVKKKKNSATFSVNLPSKTRLVKGILFNLCQIVQQKRKRVLVSLTVFFCLDCVEVHAIQTETFAEKDPS